jgi:hypothetical protein
MKRCAVRHAPELLHAVLEQAAHAAVLRLRSTADRCEAPVLRGSAEHEPAEREACAGRDAAAKETPAIELKAVP